MEDIFLISTYEDEPFDESYADDFNTHLFEDTGLTASCDEDSIITIGGIPTADVIVDLADAFAGDEPVTIEEGSAVYVNSDGNDSTGDGSEDNPYATISKAYSAVADEGTIYLLSDVEVSKELTFGTAKTVTFTSADSSNVKTIYSKLQFGYDNKKMMTVTAGEVIFKNITLDGTGQRQAAKTGFPNGVANSPGCIYVTQSGAIATLDAGTTIQNFWKNNGGSGGSSVLKTNAYNAQINIKEGALITNCVLEAGNTSDPSSVVSSGTGGIVYMTGGTVTGNTLSTTQSNSTAIVNIGMINNPHFWMTGGTISGNTINNGAAAVYMRGEANACDMQFGDTAYVYDNYLNGTSGDQRNIYLKNEKTDGTENSNVYVKLCSALDDSAKLGVYAEMIGIASKVAEGGGVSGVGTGSYTATAADATHFVSDKETGAEILYCGGSETTCGLLEHRKGDTNHNNGVSAIYLSSNPAVTATKNESDSNKIDISIDRCTSDETYVVLDKDMKPVTGKTISGGSYVSSGNGTFTLDSTSTTTIDMKGLEKDSGPYTVMLVSGSLSVGSDGKADTSSLTDIATVNIVNFAGDGVTWSDDTNSFDTGDYDIVTVPHNDQTGMADKTYTATAKTNYTFAATDAITGKLDNDEETALTVDATKDVDAEQYSVSVTVPAYGTTEDGTSGYNTVTLTGKTEGGEAGKISISDITVSADADSVGTLSENLTVTMNITDSNNYAVGTTPTYKYTVTNGRTASGDVTAATGEDGTTTYTISGLKYGDHVKIYADGEDVPAAYFKVLNTSLENGSFENVTLSTDSKYTGSSDLKTGTTIAAWHTTASDQNMEVYQSLNAYGVSASPDGGNVAELNAVEASSLYQEISTTPGSTLSWTLYHRARSNLGDDTQKMAIVIGPALDAEDDDPYKKYTAETNDMFMKIAGQIDSPVAGETYYTKYNGKTYQVTIASDTKTGGSWKNYMGTYTVPDDQEETVFAFASLGSSSPAGNLIDGVGFGTDVAITEVKAEKNASEGDKIDISIENSTKNGVYVVLDKDMKPVKDKTLSGGKYVTDGNGTFTLTDSASTTIIGMEELEKDNGPYTVMRVLSGTLSVGSDGKAVTSNLTDIATVNIVNFTGDGVTWSDGANSFESGDFDIVTVPHDDQTGMATKKYTAITKTGYVFAEDNAISGKLDNDEETALTVTATKDESAEKYSVSVTIPDYGTTSKGTTNYNSVTLTGNTEISIDVKLLDKSDGEEMTTGTTTYDGTPVAHSNGEVDGATLDYTWQKKNSDGTSYSDIEGNTAPSDAGEYNLKVTATKTDSTEVVTKDLPFTISPKTLTVNATASNKVYNGTNNATVTDVTISGAVSGDEVALNESDMSAAFEDANAGTGKTVTVSGLTLDNNDKGNYKLPDTITTTADITKADGSGAVTLEGWTYGETAKSPTATSETNGTGHVTYRYKLKNAADDTYTTEVPKNAGNYTVEATFAATNNYKAATATYDFTISPKELTATITAENKTYDGNTTATVTQTLNGVVGSDKVTAVVTNPVFADKNAGDNKTVTASITLNGTAAGNYTVNATAKTTANITAREVTISGLTATKTYDGDDTADKSEIIGTPVIGNKAADSDDVSLNTVSMTGKFNSENVDEATEVTIYGLLLTGDSAANYKLPETVTCTGTITKADGRGTVTMEGWTYGETAKTPTATSETNGTGHVTYRYKLKSATDDTYITEVPKNAGNYTVEVTFAATNNYKAATATYDFTISPKKLTVDVKAENKEYDGKVDATLSTATLVGVETADTDNVTLGTSGVSAKFNNKDAGTDKPVTLTGEYTLTGDAAKNYTIIQPTGLEADITTAPLTITGATVTYKTYDGNNNATVTKVTFNGLKNGETLTADVDYTVSDAKYDGVNATGSDAASKVEFKVTLKTSGTAANYSLTTISGSQSATIGKASRDNSTLDTKGSRGEMNTFGDASAYVVATGGIVGSDITVSDTNGIFEGAPTYNNSTGTLTYKLKSDATDGQTATVTLPVTSANYNDYSIVVTVGVTPKETVDIDIVKKDYEYDGATHAPTGITVTGDKVPVSALEVTYKSEDETTYPESKTAPTNADKYIMTVKVPDSNTKYTGSATCVFEIKPKALTATIKADDKTYDGDTTATVTPTLNGVVGSDKVTAVVSNPVFADKNAGDNKMVTASITLEGTASGNYTVNDTAKTTANITTREVTISGLTATKTYDGDDTADKSEITGTPVIGNKAVDIDDVSLNIESMTGKFNSANVDEATNVNIYGLSLTGTDASNYKLPATVTCTGTITKADGSGTVTLEGWTYGETAKSPTATSTTNPGSESSPITYQYKAKDATEGDPWQNNVPTNAGEYIVKATFPANGNYNAATATYDFTISPKELTVDVKAEDKVYDGTTTATLSTATLVGVETSDTDKVTLVISGVSAAFDNKDAGTDKPVTLTGEYTLTGDAAKNYTVTQPTGLKANITKADGNGTVTLEGWTYGDEAKTPTADSTTNPGSESSPITYQYKLKDAEDGTYTDTVPTDAGAYTVRATFPANGNYNAATATYDFTISPKELTVNVKAENKVYDGTTTATLSIATLVGVETADTDKVTLVISGVSAAFDNKDAGTDKPVTLTGSYTLTGDAAKNYTVTKPTGLEANITTREVTISGLSATKTYDGDNTADNSEITGTPVIGNKAVDGDDVSLNTESMTGEFNSANADEAANVTIYGLSLTGDSAANYKLPATVTCSGTITKADGSGAVKLDGWTYGNGAKTPTAASTTNGTGHVTYRYKLKNAADDTYTTEVPKNAGNYTVEATFAATNNYNAVVVTYDFTIARRAQNWSTTVHGKAYEFNTTAKVVAELDTLGVVGTDDNALGSIGVALSSNTEDVGENEPVTIDGRYTKTGDAVNSYTLTRLTDTTEKLQRVGNMMIIAPETGDESSIILWIVLELLSGAGVVAMIVFGKRKK